MSEPVCCAYDLPFSIFICEDTAESIYLIAAFHPVFFKGEFCKVFCEYCLGCLPQIGADLPPVFCPGILTHLIVFQTPQYPRPLVRAGKCTQTRIQTAGSKRPPFRCLKAKRARILQIISFSSLYLRLLKTVLPVRQRKILSRKDPSGIRKPVQSRNVLPSAAVPVNLLCNLPQTLPFFHHMLSHCRSEFQIIAGISFRMCQHRVVSRFLFLRQVGKSIFRLYRFRSGCTDNTACTSRNPAGQQQQYAEPDHPFSRQPGPDPAFYLFYSNTHDALLLPSPLPAFTTQTA